MEVELSVDKTKYDECNALVLPAHKTEKEVKVVKKVKKEVILSKKKRKKLEKIIERKNKKLNVSFVCKNLLFLMFLLFRDQKSYQICKS